jgi:hypothetical protein
MKYSICVALVFLVVACSNKVIDFNTQLVSSERNINNLYSSFMTKVEEVQEDSAELIVLLADSLQKTTEKELAIIGKWKMPKGGEGFKNAVANEFQFVTDMCKNIKKERGVQSTKEERLAARTWIMDSQAISDSLNISLKKAQLEYFKIHNLKVGTEQ